MSDGDTARVKRENVCTFGLFSRVLEKKNQKTEGRQSSYGIMRDQRKPSTKMRDVLAAFDAISSPFTSLDFGLLFEITV
ncbi:unnamed protein product [Angiostrongylus costaricensis]|uniref:Uncharacterized protein n=1 Tax=Angiostrongylus costaricensis TaxID=334426 RepID=A0A0R3PP98_ANGCS|nr:unnamed protein product [Angiostrongylus costaricensis]